MTTPGFDSQSTGYDALHRLGANPWRCALIGAESLLVECGKLLRARGHVVVAVASDAAGPRDWANACGVPLVQTARDLEQAGPFDLVFSITNLSVLPADILGLASCGAINFHDGPLPGYAGLNTPAWALINGERQHGITWHAMTGQVDSGDILVTRAFAVEPEETAYSLNTRCFAEGIESFDELLDALEGQTLAPVGQIAPPSRFYRRTDRPANAAMIGWNQSADAIARFVRALDFGPYANPLGMPKLQLGDHVLLAPHIDVTDAWSTAKPGTIVDTAGGLRVATATTDVVLTAVLTADGRTLSADDLAALGARAGRALDTPANTPELSAFDAALARHERWWQERLRARIALNVPLAAVATGSGSGGSNSRNVRAMSQDDAIASGAGAYTAGADTIFAAVAASLGRVADQACFDVGFTDPVFATRNATLGALAVRHLPLRIDIDPLQTLGAVRQSITQGIGEAHRRIGHAVDLIARTPDLRGAAVDLPVALVLVDRLDDSDLLPGAQLTVAVRSDGRACRWIYDPSVLDESAILTLRGAFGAVLAAAVADPATPVGDLPLLDAADRARVVEAWNATASEWRADACLHRLFVEQAARTPDAPAVTSGRTALSYAALDSRSTQLARHLAGLGVGRDALVGLHLDRSVDMVVALIAVHKAGGAYVPLDPAYPAARLQHMIDDSAASVIVTHAHRAAALPATAATIVRIDADWPAIAQHAGDPLPDAVRPDDLAYVIYTSGSTGLPKGVTVEHRNVVNFFAGMDQRIEPGGTWLAVTSLSFDISVLELCWTLARGAHVVIAGGETTKPTRPAPAKPIDFSLFYFASTDSGSAADQYRLLLDGAVFADTHDFAAIWTPERHFHAFGGLYPNPSVTSAAVAAITSRIKIRGGSVVMPLHHPLRVAEEWSLVDNLSNGRVGIAFASGWQPNDFVLRPETFADRPAALMNGIDTVRALWRGETRAFPGPLGTDVEVGIYPRPVQPELPFWITTAGNSATFEAAGKAGASVLTHLLGQTAAELADKIAGYRAARAAAGHAGPGHVTLMLHTFVAEDAEIVREAVRAPLTAYLRTSTNLVKEFAWSFPAFKRRPGMTDATPDLAQLDEAEMAALLDHAFERYYATSGLFGTPAQCLEMVDAMRGVGVDEIGCLIDFGVPARQVLDQLPALDALRRLANDPSEAADTLPALMLRHRVTHLQCTPSMAQMLVADPDARAALTGLRCMMVGGEALPPVLAQRLGAMVGGQLLNMYGPTETTIWSTTHAVQPGDDRSVPIGRALANQQCFVLDHRQQPMPTGVPGELVIAGRGVVRGYLDRAALTAERFVAVPAVGVARAYRTGDLVRQRGDGTLEFLGRLDHQVKIRGHRIELGEIEAVLAARPDIEQALVAAREDSPGDVRLVAYYVASGASAAPVAELQQHLRAHLPDFMVPAYLVPLAAMPQTPNGKVDRSRLPPPEATTIAAAPVAFVAPASDVEAVIAAVWRDVLKLPSVGTRDNFFDLGGHSLLAVQLHRDLRTALGRPLPLTDIFRFPTIATLAAHLGGGDSGGTGDGGTAPHRAEMRALNRRAALRRRHVEPAMPLTAGREA